MAWLATINSVGKWTVESPTIPCLATFTDAADASRTYQKTFSIDKSAPSLSTALDAAVQAELAQLLAEDQNIAALNAMVGSTVKTS
jgi:hypothetical protein